MEGEVIIFSKCFDEAMKFVLVYVFCAHNPSKKKCRISS